VEVLPPEEIRVLGVLVEKERTVPDSYPLTLNALTAGCNQSSNREPVTAYEPDEVEAALRSLRERGLTRVVHSPSNRAEKFRHVLGDALGLEADVLAVLAVLLLRGPQTANELRIRTERYEPGVPDVEAALRVLSTRDENLAVNIGRRSGQREERWMHLLGGEVTAPGPSGTDDFVPSASSRPVTSSLADRVAALEARVAALEEGLGVSET
jgi:uncharacterized protein YceH (UPF0502 family)